MREKPNHSNRTQALKLIGPRQPVLDRVSLMEPVTDSGAGGRGGPASSGPRVSVRECGTESASCQARGRSAGKRRRAASREAVHAYENMNSPRRASDGQRASQSCQGDGRNILGGLLAPGKLGSSLPVRAMSGQGVVTLLHPDTHAPSQS